MAIRFPGYVFIVFFLTASVFAAEYDHDSGHNDIDGHGDGHEQYAEHVHGQAKLLVAVEDVTLEILFQSPAMNLLGFEHAPASSRQREQVALVVAALNRPDGLFVMPAGAGCRLIEATVDMPFHENRSGDTAEPEYPAAHRHGHAGEATMGYSGHAEIQAHYRYQCHHGAPPETISVRLFEYFPLTESIRVQRLSASGQKAFDLTSGNNTFPL